MEERTSTAMTADFKKLDQRNQMRIDRLRATEELLKVSQGVDLLRYIFTGLVLLGVVVGRSWNTPLTGKDVLTAVLAAVVLHVILFLLHNKWGMRQRDRLNREFPEPSPYRGPS